MPSFFGTASGFLLLALCYSSVDYGLKAASLYYRAHSWHTITGTLKTHRLQEELDPNGGYVARNRFCDVEYNYSVSGVFYIGRRANIWGYLDEVRFCDFLDVRGSVGGVKIYFNPQNPQESVLDRRIRPLSLSSVIFTVVSLAYASFMVLLFDDVFKNLSPIIASLMSFLMALFLLLFCDKIQKLTNCTIAICSGFSTAVFVCFSFTYWLLWMENSKSGLEWLYQDGNSLFSMPYVGI